MREAIKLGELGRLYQFGSPSERRMAELEMQRIATTREAGKMGQRQPVATPEMARSFMSPPRADSGRPEVPFGTESRGIPSMPLSQAQIEANNRYAYAKRLENELGISRAQSQLAMQPLLAGVQRGILGKIGSRFGINPSAYPMPQYPQQTAFGGQGFNWQNIGYAPPFPQRMVG